MITQVSINLPVLFFFFSDEVMHSTCSTNADPDRVDNGDTPAPSDVKYRHKQTINISFVHIQIAKYSK